MKTKLFAIASIVLLSLSFSSCSDEEIVPQDSKTYNTDLPDGNGVPKYDEDNCPECF